MVFWKDLRVSEALEQSVDLPKPILSDNFDGASWASWTLELSKAIAPIVTLIFGFVVAKRGELEITKGDKTIRMKNLKPSQLKEFLEIINDDQE